MKNKDSSVMDCAEEVQTDMWDKALNSWYKSLSRHASNANSIPLERPDREFFKKAIMEHVIAPLGKCNPKFAEEWNNAIDAYFK